MISLFSLGQINITPNQHYKFHLVFFEKNFRETTKQLKEIIGGGCLVVSVDEILLYYFEREDEIIQRISFKNIKLKINKVFLISSNHCVVSFDNFFEVYNFHTSQKVVEIKFEENIKFFECNTNVNYVNNLRNFEKNSQKVYLFLLFESTQINIYSIDTPNSNSFDLSFKNEKTYERNHECNQIKIQLLAKSFNIPNVEYVSCGFIKEMSPYIFNSEYFCITLSNGNILMLPTLKIKDSINNSKMLILKVKMLDSNIKFRLLESDSNLLLIGSNGSLFFTIDKNSNKRLFEIQGQFQDGRICLSQDNKIKNLTKIVAVSKATIIGYVLNYSLDKDHYAYYQLFKINAHQDYLTFMFVKGRIIQFTVDLPFLFRDRDQPVPVR